MDLRHLRYFQAVAEELSYSRAARRLHIAQPALSRAVQELEEELGVLLIDRKRRTIRLTPGGEVLLRETGRIFENLDDTQRKVRRTASGDVGELRLGYIGPPTRSFLGPLLKRYHQRYPRVTIVLEERTPERVWEMVSKGRLSVGLTRPVLAHEALGLQSLSFWYLVQAMPPDETPMPRMAANATTTPPAARAPSRARRARSAGCASSSSCWPTWRSSGSPTWASPR